MRSLEPVFGQTHSDSSFVREIICLELKERDTKMGRPYAIHQTAQLSPNSSRYDTVHTQYALGKEIDWAAFGISSRLGYFTNELSIDSCLFIYAPLFNAQGDRFKIRYELRYQNATSYFTVDLYRKKRGKWHFIRSERHYSF